MSEIPDEVIEAMAKAMGDIYANSEQANEAWRGLVKKRFMRNPVRR